MESWKSYQNKARIQNSIRYLAYTAIAVLLLMGVVSVVKLYVWFKEPLVPDARYVALSTTDWNGRHQFNFYVNEDFVMAFDPATDQLRYMHISPEEINSLLVSMHARGVLLEGYIVLPSNLEEPSDLPSELYTHLRNSELKGSITRGQLWRLWWSLRGDIAYEEVDTALPEPDIATEDLRISILNGTSFSGLATTAAMWVNNIGADVSEVGNATQKVKTTYIEVFFDEWEDSPTMRRLQDIFPEAEIITSNETVPQRFDLQVTVGDDFVR